MPMTELEQNHSFGRVIDVLEAIGAEYAIFGGLAVVAYGEPRFTMDMDVLLSPAGFLTNLFIRRLLEQQYHVDDMAVRRALLEGGTFNVIDQHTQIKSDFFVLHQNPQLREALKSRVHLPFDEVRQAAYISVMSLINTKLKAFAESESTRHLDDVASIIRVQGLKVDVAVIDRTAARYRVFGAWRHVWEANQPD